ncbi:MAG: SLC13 family permease [Lachnospiraceae bacterium]|nr:SLC13 family permease [Lachnospiraceae bacterium]
MNRKRAIHLVIGPVLFALFAFGLPASVFESFASRAAIGTVAWMAYWWVTGPIDYAVTAFLPIALNAVFQMTEMSGVIANYASETILLLLGASILTVSWEKTGLDKRIAAAFLKMVGSDFRMQLVFWFILSALLSAVLPNAVVCATVTPIAVSMLNYIGEGDIAKSKVGSKLLLSIAYATGLGGLASPLGGAMNLVTVEHLQQLTGQEYIYVDWVIRFLPIMVVLMISNILFMLRDVKKGTSLGGTREYFVEQYKKLPKMSFEEKMALLLFVLATVLSFTRQFYQAYLPGLKPAYVFIICAIISFLITDSNGERLMLWNSVQKQIVWELIYIFAGGLAAGTLIKGSGAADAIGAMVADMNLSGGIPTIFVIITLTLLLSDVTSNTATAAVAIPVVISVVQGIGLNPIPFVYIASVGVNLSYMLPTSIRAIPVGYGLQPKYMLKEGAKMTVMVIVLMTIVCTLLYRYWPAFSTV